MYMYWHFHVVRHLSIAWCHSYDCSFTFQCTTAHYPVSISIDMRDCLGKKRAEGMISRKVWGIPQATVSLNRVHAQMHALYITHLNLVGTHLEK